MFLVQSMRKLGLIAEASQPMQAEDSDARTLSRHASLISSSAAPRFGLQVLHEPPTETADSPAANLIFVHGLGGSATETWTHRPSNLVWPSLLHEDYRFANVRIATFGYDSAFKNIFTSKHALGISDFAKQLLDSLDLHYDKHGDGRTIFIAHSMGGLIVKQAIIDAYNDRSYTRVLKNVKAIIFIGTPHRGANLAQILTNLLHVLYSLKVFVEQLQPSSELIQAINDQFRDRSESLELVSFYESKGVPGLGVIVPRDSATLGIARERCSALNGNHIDIVKFSSTEDDNYVRVSGNIAKLIEIKNHHKAQLNQEITLTKPSQSSYWSSVSVETISTSIAAICINGRIHIFARDLQSKLVHLRWENGEWEDSWSETFITARSDPAIIQYSPEDLAVYVLNDDNECRGNRFRISEDGIRKLFDNDYPIGFYREINLSNFAPPTAISTYDSHSREPERGQAPAHVFVFRKDGEFIHCWWHPDVGWCNWNRLGRDMNINERSMAVCRGTGHLDILALGKDKRIYYKHWNFMTQKWDKKWTPLGDRKFNSKPTAVARDKGCLYVFGIDENYNICYREWNDEKGWRMWKDIPFQGMKAGSITCVCYPKAYANRIDVFVVSIDGICWHMFWARDGDSWSKKWENIGGGYLRISSVSAVYRSSIEIVLLGIREDHVCVYKNLKI